MAPDPELPPIELTLPAEVLEAIAARAALIAADLVAAKPEPWLTVEQAAEHLACPKSRIYAMVSARGTWNGSRIPHRKDGSRLLFRASELDSYIYGGGARRP